MPSAAQGVALVAMALTVVSCGRTAVATSASSSAACQIAGPAARLAELPEASGLALSRRMPGHFWTLNDSSQPVLFLLDGRGAVTGRLQVSGATVDDWEAVAVGPCPSGSCIFVGDIGDNNARRTQITVYRVTEPELMRRGPSRSASDATASASAEAFHARYPDGPQDAETLLVAADGGIYVVTKGSTGPVALYKFPRDLKAGGTSQLERVGTPRSPARVRKDEEITDGAVSPDGARIVLRTHHTLLFFRAAPFLAGHWQPELTADLMAAREPQGEGVAFGPDNSIYLTGESGGGAHGGTFAHVTCTP